MFEKCQPFCSGTKCHCQSCGETGCSLNEDGYCAMCVAAMSEERDDFEKFSPIYEEEEP